MTKRDMTDQDSEEVDEKEEETVKEEKWNEEAEEELDGDKSQRAQARRKEDGEGKGDESKAKESSAKERTEDNEDKADSTLTAPRTLAHAPPQRVTSERNEPLWLFLSSRRFGCTIAALEGCRGFICRAMIPGIPRLTLHHDELDIIYQPETLRRQSVARMEMRNCLVSQTAAAPARPTPLTRRCVSCPGYEARKASVTLLSSFHQAQHLASRGGGAEESSKTIMTANYSFDSTKTMTVILPTTPCDDEETAVVAASGLTTRDDDETYEDENSLHSLHRRAIFKAVYDERHDLEANTISRENQVPTTKQRSGPTVTFGRTDDADTASHCNSSKINSVASWGALAGCLHKLHLTRRVHDTVEWPHRFSHQPLPLCLLMMDLMLLSVAVSSLAFIVPLPSVERGVQANFWTVVMFLGTYYEMLWMGALLVTCRTATTNSGLWHIIPKRAWISTGVILILIQKIMDAALTMIWWPVPFSIVWSGAICHAMVVPVLGWVAPLFAPTSNRINEDNWRDLSRLLWAYWLTLLIAGCWGIFMRIFHTSSLTQIIVGSLFGPLRFVCKILMTAPLVLRLCPRKLNILLLVVDIIFVRVQISIFPFITGYISFGCLLVAELLTVAWKFYAGVDRLQLWWSAVTASLQKEEEPPQEQIPGTPPVSERRSSLVHDQFGGSMRKVTAGCLMAPTVQVSQLNLSLRNLNSQPVDDSPTILPMRPRGMSAPAVFDASIEAGKSCTATIHVIEEKSLQRPLFHIIDACGYYGASLAVRLGHQLILSAARNLPSFVDMNDSYRATDDQWSHSQVYAWTYVAFMVTMLACLGPLFFSRLKVDEGRKPLTLSLVFTYIFRENFWFTFFWLAATGGYVVVAMLRHFGVDFSFQFSSLP